jgi:hypothetical protein
VFLIGILVLGPLLATSLVYLFSWASTPLQDLGMPSGWSYLATLAIAGLGSGLLVRSFLRRRP